MKNHFSFRHTRHPIERHFRFVATLSSFLLTPFAHAQDRCRLANDQFVMSAFGARYSCQKVGCDPTNSGTEPLPSPTPDTVKVQLLCDSEAHLTVRIDGKTTRLDGFDTREKCQRAADQFKKRQGCYCTVDNIPKCLVRSTPDIKFDEMSPAYSRSESCVDALKGLSQGFEIKKR